jgi:WD40 repeat protein
LLDGKYLAFGSSNKKFKLWDVESQKQVTLLGRHSSWVNSVSFSPDGEYLASGREDKTVKLWRVESKFALTTL